nr:MAG TPA: hypothetical protein [Caudoviricetes sp.]
MDKLYKVIFNYDHIPFWVRKEMRNWYMENRNEAVDIFNTLIDSVNKDWKSFDEPSAFGDYVEDLNPMYVDCIRRTIQPKFDELNKTFKKFEYQIDEYGNIIGRIKGKRKSKIYITFKEVEL